MCVCDVSSCCATAVWLAAPARSENTGVGDKAEKLWFGFIIKTKGITCIVFISVFIRVKQKREREKGEKEGGREGGGVL